MGALPSSDGAPPAFQSPTSPQDGGGGARSVSRVARPSGTLRAKSVASDAETSFARLSHRLGEMSKLVEEFNIEERIAAATSTVALQQVSDIDGSSTARLSERLSFGANAGGRPVAHTSPTRSTQTTDMAPPPVALSQLQATVEVLQRTLEAKEALVAAQRSEILALRKRVAVLESGSK